MSLPIIAGEQDVQSIVDYLKTKATGSTIGEAKAVLVKEVLDGRKINAYVMWGIVTKDGERLKLAELGHELSRAKPEDRSSVYSKILGSDVNSGHQTFHAASSPA